jgi:hypothetical protein
LERFETRGKWINPARLRLCFRLILSHQFAWFDYFTAGVTVRWDAIPDIATNRAREVFDLLDLIPIAFYDGNGFCSGKAPVLVGTESDESKE